ncbi:MAG: PAS domain S-box protein [Bacteroidia bacterium]|nr:PAS domain S-box protein [Bacteroidia bacterium]
MDYTEKTKEELINELLNLQRSYDAVREQFDNTFMTSPDSVNINRLSDGMYVSINEGFTKILGYTAKEVIGKTSIELNIWANPGNRITLAKELKKKGRVENFEAIFRKKDGSFANGLMSASLIDLDGVPHILNVTKNITARKQIEEAFTREQFLVTALLNNLPDHIYFKDIESRFIRINKSHAQSLGLTDPEQAAGKTDFDFHTPEHARQAYNDEQIIIQTGQPLTKEERLVHANSPDSWVYATKLPLRNNEGKIIGTFGISRDITKRKKVEEELAAEHNLLRTLIDNMPDRIYAKDLNSRFVVCNNALVKRMGMANMEDIIGKSDFDLLPQELADQYYNQEQSIIRSGEPLINHEESSMGNVSGTKRWNQTTKVPLRDSSGNIIGIIGMGRDITDRKRREMESQVLFEITQGITTSDNLDELLKLIHHSLGKVVYAENCFVALHDQETGLFSFPYFVDKIDSTPLPTSMRKSYTAYVFRTVKPLLFTPKIFEQLKEQNKVELVGSPPLSWIGIPLQTPSKVIGVLVLQHYEKENVYSESDVNFLISIGSQIAIAIERKKAEEEIKLKNELLQTINAEKDKFFSIIAHDLRGPLSAFVDATRILAEEIQSMTLDEIRDITISMKTSASNIYSLLENLLEWSRLRRDVMDFVPEKLNLKKKIDACIDVLSESAREKQIEIAIFIPDELEVLADNHMFDTVIRNLLSNAIKFTPVGGKVSVTARCNNDHFVEVKIIDSGIGMTPELKNKLFLISEKTSRPGTEGEMSTGLGLLLVKEFIEKHGGKIWVDSEVGKGSTFSFTIGQFKNLKMN